MLSAAVAVSALQLSAQATLSGITIWESNASGAWLQTSYWNTLGWEGPPEAPAGGDANTVSNAYLFTGTVGSPSFINSANSNSSLNPNQSLSAGTYTFGIAGNNSAGTDTYVAINLYFDGNLGANRISAVVPKNGTSNFSVISAATTTFGETGNTGPGVTGAALLSYTSGGYTITLTDLSFLPRGSSPNLVSMFSVGPGGYAQAGDYDYSPDTIGSMTLTVTAIPEPASCTAWVGLAALGLAVWRRWRRFAPPARPV